jgi:hypothetical protein
MALTVMQCPNCRGEIQVDNSHDFGFCMYCGTKIQLNTRVDIDGVNSLRNMFARAEGFAAVHNYDAAKKAYEEINDKYPTCLEAKLDWIKIYLSDTESNFPSREVMINDMVHYMEMKYLSYNPATREVVVHENFYGDTLIKTMSIDKYAESEAKRRIRYIPQINNDKVTGYRADKLIDRYTQEYLYIANSNQKAELYEIFQQAFYNLNQKADKYKQETYYCIEEAQRRYDKNIANKNASLNNSLKNAYNTLNQPGTYSSMYCHNCIEIKHGFNSIRFSSFTDYGNVMFVSVKGKLYVQGSYYDNVITHVLWYEVNSIDEKGQIFINKGLTKVKIGEISTQGSKIEIKTRNLPRNIEEQKDDAYIVDSLIQGMHVCPICQNKLVMGICTTCNLTTYWVKEKRRYEMRENSLKNNLKKLTY